MASIRVLILEDDHDIVELIRSILEPSFECFVACNGLEGLQQAMRGEPDLIICDIMMPVMDGREFIKRLRAMVGFERVPVIYLSALSSHEHIREGYQRGAALYLTKPIEPQRLKRNLEMFIRDHDVKPTMKKVSIEDLKLTPVETRKSAAQASAPPVESGSRRPDSQPAESREPPASETYSWPKESEEPVAGKGPRTRLLVVEDDVDTCSLIRHGLEGQYEIVEANDGITAIEFAVRYKPDVFIIDGMLPRMTGYQLALMLKKNREFYRSPIIFISGKASERDRHYVQRLGVNHFLGKPFTAQRLRGLIEEFENSPDFSVRTDRTDYNRIPLETFQRMGGQRARPRAGDRSV